MLNNDIRTPINILRPSEIVKFHPAARNAAELLAAEICFINFPDGQLISFYLLTFASPAPPEILFYCCSASVCFLLCELSESPGG